jgi:antitoxin FitA
MTIQITVRNVPEKVRDELAARAARRGQSMQEFLRAELERLAARPSVDEVLGRIRERKALARTKLDPDEIIAARDADRR